MHLTAYHPHVSVTSYGARVASQHCALSSELVMVSYHRENEFQTRCFSLQKRPPSGMMALDSGWNGLSHPESITTRRSQ